MSSFYRNFKRKIFERTLPVFETVVSYMRGHVKDLQREVEREHDYDINHIEYNKDGFFAVYYVGGKWVKTKFKDPMGSLRRNVRFKGEFTLRPFFEHVRDSPELKEFISRYSWVYNIDAHLAQLDAEKEEYGSDSIDMLHVKLSWSADYCSDFFAFGADFGGMGVFNENYEDEHSPFNIGDEIGVGISVAPLWDFCDLPFIVDNKFSYYDFHKYDSLSMAKYIGIDRCRSDVNIFDMTLTHLGERDFTLLEFLDAVFWEISFYGSPRMPGEEKWEKEYNYEEYTEEEKKKNELDDKLKVKGNSDSFDPDKVWDNIEDYIFGEK